MENQIPDSDENSMASIPRALREEEQLALIWGEQDYQDHEQTMHELIDHIVGLRSRIMDLRTQIENLWDRFVSLTLERILAAQIRELLDELDGGIHAFSLRLVEMDCEIDRLRARVQERQRSLESKIALLEPLAHRTSTQNHLNMMLARVEGLEAYLLGKKDVTPEAYDLHYKRHTTAPGDLLYIRIRLLTTQVAINASNRSKQLSELGAALATLLPEVEQLKTALALLIARIECVSDLSRYWLAYLDIADQKKPDPLQQYHGGEDQISR
ncbi:MAG: hypothetical protein U1F42_05785 [Candidatus Competibacteraceae bacterium]